MGKKELVFGVEDQIEEERDYTMVELVGINSGRATCTSLLIDDSEEGVDFNDCIECGESRVGKEMDDMPDTAHALPPVKDPKVAATAKLEITLAEAKKCYKP